jgi:hypothetical protein
MQRWEKIAAAVDAEFAHECELKLTEMRTSDGRVQYRRQCQICGATGQALKMARLTHAEFSTRTAHDPEIQTTIKFFSILLQRIPKIMHGFGNMMLIFRRPSGVSAGLWSCNGPAEFVRDAAKIERRWFII